MRVKAEVGLFVLGAVAAAMCLPLTGCKKASSRDPSAMDAGGDSYAEDASADPLAELDALEGRMRELGLAPKHEASVGDDAGGEGEAKARTRDEAELGAMAEGEIVTDSVTAEEAPEADPEPAPAAATEAPYREPAQDRCSNLCSLSESICELEVRICELSESHTGDTTYADACERAIDDCELSGEACNTCES